MRESLGRRAATRSRREIERPDAGKILLSNVYGWFERINRVIFGLTNADLEALMRWPI